MPATRRLLLTASAGLAAPFVRRAAAARSLILAAPPGAFQEVYEATVLDGFRRAYPDIGVFWYALPSSAQALSVLRRQKSQPEIDVALLDVAAARTATEEGLLEPPTGLPVLAELAPSAVFPGVAGPALFTEPLVMVVDAARLRPGPLVWKALWNEGEGRTIAIPAPPDDIGVAFALVAGRLFGGGNHQRALNDGLLAIKELERRVVSFDPKPDIYRFMGEGRALFGMGWNMPAQFHAGRSNGRVRAVFPEDGTLSRVTTVGLVRGGRQPEAARLLVAYLLGVEGQKTMVERLALGPVNARARYPEAALARTGNTPARVARAMAVDWVSVNALRDDLAKRWSEMMRG